MRRASNHVLVLILLTALVLVAAGCGGGGKKSSAVTTAPSATTAPEVPTTTEATTTAALSPLAKNCLELLGISQKLNTAFNGTVSSAEVKKDAQLLKEFVDRAPSKIRADLRVLSAAVTKIAAAYGRLKPGQPLSQAEEQKLLAQIDVQKLTLAEQHLTAWVKANCNG
jgi:hypothetical protein